MNDTIMIAGDLRPTPATTTMSPRVTARLYAGAVEATPMTMLETMPSAFDFRPLAPLRGTVQRNAAVGLRLGKRNSCR